MVDTLTHLVKGNGWVNLFGKHDNATSEVRDVRDRGAKPKHFTNGVGVDLRGSLRPVAATSKGAGRGDIEFVSKLRKQGRLNDVLNAFFASQAGR
jgi:hypothetical protein